MQRDTGTTRPTGAPREGAAALVFTPLLYRELEELPVSRVTDAVAEIMRAALPAGASIDRDLATNIAGKIHPGLAFDLRGKPIPANLAGDSAFRHALSTHFSASAVQGFSEEQRKAVLDTLAKSNITGADFSVAAQKASFEPGLQRFVSGEAGRGDGGAAGSGGRTSESVRGIYEAQRAEAAAGGALGSTYAGSGGAGYAGLSGSYTAEQRVIADSYRGSGYSAPQVEGLTRSGITRSTADGLARELAPQYGNSPVAARQAVAESAGDIHKIGLKGRENVKLGAEVPEVRKALARGDYAAARAAAEKLPPEKQQSAKTLIDRAEKQIISEAGKVFKNVEEKKNFLKVLEEARRTPNDPKAQAALQEIIKKHSTDPNAARSFKNIEDIVKAGNAIGAQVKAQNDGEENARGKKANSATDMFSTAGTSGSAAVAGASPATAGTTATAATTPATATAATTGTAATATSAAGAGATPAPAAAEKKVAETPVPTPATPKAPSPM